MDDLLEINWIRPKCTIQRPLLGLTILLVEDSRYCAEAVRLLSIRSGARLRRADSLKSARRHMRIYRPDVVLIDLGLPDGSGLEIIHEMSHGPVPTPAIIATSGDTGDARDDALKAGAAFFMAKPIADLASFQQTILASLPDEIKPIGFVPRLTGSCVKPDAQAMKDDLDHIAGLMDDCFAKNDIGILSYAAQFLNSLGRDAGDKRILQASEKLQGFAKSKAFPHDAVRHEFQIIRNAVGRKLAQSVKVY